MQVQLTDIFYTQLYAMIDAFQITRVELPAEFQNAILSSIEAKQNITRTERYKENMLVTYQTQVLIANQTARQTIALARGTASQRVQQAEAVATVTEQKVYAEMYAYGNLSQTVNLNESDILDYMWWEEQISNKGKEYLVGLDPKSYIRSTS